MFRTLELKNFQSHKKTMLEFVPGVNAIVGTSDSGKSAIIRAINLIVNNRPSGIEYLNNSMDKKDSCIVSLKMDECSVVREKNNRTGKNQINRYILDDNELKAMGVGIPDEVQAKLNMSELNTQYQMDAPFLISETPGEVARVLNRVVNLDIIDKSLSRAESQKRSINSQIKLLSEQLENREDDLKKFDTLDDMDYKLQILEETDKCISEAVDASNDIVNILEEFDELKKQDFSILNAENELNSTIALHRHISLNDDTLCGLNDVISRQNSLSHDLKQLNVTLDIEPEITSLEVLNEEITTISGDIKLLNYEIDTYYKCSAPMRKLNVLANIDINSMFEQEINIEKMQKKHTSIFAHLALIQDFNKKLNELKIKEMEQEFYAMLPEKCSPDICPLLNGDK